MPDPKVQASTDHPRLSAWTNPRGLPPKWVDAYLNRQPELLALDMIRSYDEIVDLKENLSGVRTRLWIASAAAGVAFAVSMVLLAALLGKI
jgi:hypothetical protein